MNQDGTRVRKKKIDELGIDVWDILKWVDKPFQINQILTETYPDLIDGYRIVGALCTIDESQDNELKILFAVVRKPLDSILFQPERVSTHI